MKNIEDLNKSSVEELLGELKVREENILKATGATSLWADRAVANTKFSEFDTETIVEVLINNQKILYGDDDREDVSELSNQGDLNHADSVVALFLDKKIIDNGDGTSTLKTRKLGEKHNLCSEERFWDQPVGAFCSGFLAAPNIIVTAGHCVKPNNVTDIRFVFGFRMQNATTPTTIIDNSEIYRGIEIIERQEISNGPDWALVRIDRPVTNHPIAKIRRAGKINDTQAVYVIGHPVGLPAKFAGGASVRNNQPKAWFVANLDTFGGNSGSPVFNSDTHEVEGILVRGDVDFVPKGSCMVAQVFPTTGGRGEDCTRTTEFAYLINNT
jgi:hypothetical protein